MRHSCRLLNFGILTAIHANDDSERKIHGMEDK
jgi:hypothetical protein